MKSSACSTPFFTLPETFSNACLMPSAVVTGPRFEGTFDDIYAVLKQIDSDDQILNVDRMTISRPSGADLADGNGSENDSTEKLLEVELDISAFARQAKETDRWLTD